MAAGLNPVLSAIFQSSRSLRTATLTGGIKHGICKEFQSSRSLRTATFFALSGLIWAAYFNPRGPCGPRHPSHNRGLQSSYFNPRGPCGPRRLSLLFCATMLLFQSSRSLRTATEKLHVLASPAATFQSSRSLRTATSSACVIKPTHRHFNPRGPCGPRRCLPTGYR